MSAWPATTPTTTPLKTVATAVLDERQLARSVTSLSVPSESVAVALKCDALPGLGAIPVSDTRVAVGPDEGGVEDPIVRCTWAVTFWYVALISVSPAATPFT